LLTAGTENGIHEVILLGEKWGKPRGKAGNSRELRLMGQRSGPAFS
jgi:hypothetical protein